MNDFTGLSFMALYAASQRVGDSVKKALDLARDGLYLEEAQRKQWVLEQILDIFEVDLDSLEADRGAWEKGIAP